MSIFPRSWLFTPGSRSNRFKKAVESSADAIILDLEDAVAEPNKREACRDVIEFLQSRDTTGCSVAVRVNALASATGLEDLAKLARLTCGPDFILLPKVEESAEISLADRVLLDTGSPAKLLALIESAQGVSLAAGIARATQRLAALVFGAADYAADVGQQVGIYQPDFARAAIVNSAAAGGIPAIDFPFFAIDQLDGLGSECQTARSMGFFGKAAIHPSQLSSINKLFSPTSEERALALKILQAAPDGVGAIDGKMIDIAMVRWARRIA